MGCNAHVHIEVKKNEKWYHFAAPDVRRDYFVYAAMAGERLEDLPQCIQKRICPAAESHEMPNDISEVTEICYKQDGEAYHLHNVSVITAEGLHRLQQNLNELNALPRSYDLEEDIFHTYVGGNTLAQHQGWDDLRVILWFDN